MVWVEVAADFELEAIGVGGFLMVGLQDSGLVLPLEWDVEVGVEGGGDSGGARRSVVVEVSDAGEGASEAAGTRGRSELGR